MVPEKTAARSFPRAGDGRLHPNPSRRLQPSKFASPPPERAAGTSCGREEGGGVALLPSSRARRGGCGRSVASARLAGSGHLSVAADDAPFWSSTALAGSEVCNEKAPCFVASWRPVPSGDASWADDGGRGWLWPPVAWLWLATARRGLAVAGRGWPRSGCGGLWPGRGLDVVGRRLFLLRQRGISVVTMVMGPEGLAGACCGAEVVLRDATVLFQWWCCGGDGERATTMTISGR
jgi:hypothetical protein